MFNNMLLHATLASWERPYTGQAEKPCVLKCHCHSQARMSWDPRLSSAKGVNQLPLFAVPTTFQS